MNKIKNLSKKLVNSRSSKIKLLALDFDGVFTNNKVLIDETGKEYVTCDRSDGLGIEILKEKTNIEIIILSKEKNNVVESRCKKLGIKCIHGIDNKLIVLKEEIKKRKIGLENVCFVGNDINDISCLKNVGVSIGVADSHPIVLKIADYITLKKGGEGAIREVCEFLFNVKNLRKNS